MLSNLVITAQRTVLIIDDLGRERIAHKFICQLLREQGQDDATIKVLPFSNELKNETIFDLFLAECAKETEIKWNVLLPPLSNLLCYQSPAVIFQFLYKLRKCTQVRRTFLWVSTKHIFQAHATYIISACEYLSQLVLHFETDTELTILTRKPGGGITNKRYIYRLENDQFLVEPFLKQKKVTDNPTENVKAEQMGTTFKIELDEDELVARNALKLPYERTSEPAEGNIIYTPDAADDFDDEDPDEDLCI